MPGCFAWCPRQVKTPSQSIIETKSSKRLSDLENQVTPSTAMYAIDGGLAFAEALESVSDLIPIPLLSNFVGVAIKVLEACEEATIIEENVKDLQGRVYNLTLVVIHTVPVSGNTSVELRGRIKQLQSLLDIIIADLTKIKEQKKWLLVFFRTMNKERIDKCKERLNAALEQFNVGSQLRVEDLLEKIKSDYSAFAAQLNRIEEAVHKTNQPHNAPLPRQDMPPPPHIFFGREHVVDNIVSLLVSEHASRVCIAGVGGMGKTSVALAVIDSATIKDAFAKRYIFWVPCVEAKSADLLRRILYAQLRITAESYDSLDPLIAELDASKERRLLLLDNFETPWLSGQPEDQTRVGDILVRLAALSHISLLVTMTSGFAPGDIQWQTIELPSLDPTAARNTFETLYPAVADSPKLEELSKALDRNPLAITLMAAHGKGSHASADDLLQEWNTTGTEMISRVDRAISMSVHRVEVMESNHNALTLFAILSMIPAGTTGINLRWWAPNLTSYLAPVQILRTAALIEQDDESFETSRIFVRTTIQYMPPVIRFVIDHRSTPDDSTFKSDLKALASEETNIQGLLMQIDVHTSRPRALEALIAFAFYQSWTKPSTVLASHAVMIATAAHEDPDVPDPDAAARRVAEAHQCLGKTLFRLDQYNEAYAHFEEARGRFKDLPGGPDLPHAGECSLELLRTQMFINIADGDELEPLVEELKASLSHDENQKYHVARGLFAVGYFLWWSRAEDEDTLNKLGTAKQIFEELDCPASTAECLYVMARTYIRRYEHLEGLPLAREALGKAEQSGDALLISDIALTVAGCLIALELYDEALGSVEQSLSSAQAVGNPLGIAQNLEFLGYCCAAKMDLPGARIAYEGARMQFAKIKSVQARNSLAICSVNLEELGRITEIDKIALSALKQSDFVHN
ncbi:hypothetical protein MVEN_00574300 [Mycena venus]|uniref:Novel STAND NTPase 1 domain-containing protein n=1 Tax=Mycena venus TaxID=2733690 RepID=A0A8H7D821_9AGAR|nr:hypothetical protein MVEN_00574300 [Mycena venus]